MTITAPTPGKIRKAWPGSPVATYTLTTSDSKQAWSDGTTINLIGIYVGVAGDVTTTDLWGNTALWKNVPTGSIIPYQGSIVNTATTATNLVGLVGVGV